MSIEFSQKIPLVCGNWKMNKSVNESIALTKELVQSLSKLYQKPSCEIVIAPSCLALYPVAQVLSNSSIFLAAQNCFWEPTGAFTGEVSPKYLKELGCRYVLVGHSERRKWLGETNDHIRRKIQALFEQNLIPILCIGETAEEHNQDQTWSILDAQLDQALSGWIEQPQTQLVLAYEPVWAIGTGVTASPAWIEKVHSFLYQWVKNKFGPLAQSVRIVYGGSVTEEQTHEIVKKPHVSGVLVGSASLHLGSFLRIIGSCEAAT